MVLTLERFRTNFDSYPVPHLLKNLLAFQNTSFKWYSQGFELSIITPEELGSHVPKEAFSQFFGFGHDGNYSLYVLWRYKEISLDEAPVVYFNSEGEGSGVIAHNLPEFLTLLAYDKEPIFGVYPEKVVHDDVHSERNEEFRLWLAHHYSLNAAEHPNEIVRQARHHYPAVPLIYPSVQEGT